MGTKAIWAVVTVLFIGICGIGIYLYQQQAGLRIRQAAQAERYYLVTNKDGKVYKIDRQSGRTWLIKGTTITEVNELGPEPIVISAPVYTPAYEPVRPQDIPISELVKMTVKTEFMYNTCYVSLYNPTGWRITEIKIRLHKLQGDWDRVFRNDVTIEPQTTGRFNFDAGAYLPDKTYAWGIASAKGYRTAP